MKQKELIKIFMMTSYWFPWFIQRHVSDLTLSSMNLPLSSSSTTSRDCCHNSQLVVDEDDLKWMANKKVIFMKMFVLKHLGFRNLSHSSEVPNCALIHRECSEG